MTTELRLPRAPSLRTCVQALLRESCRQLSTSFSPRLDAELLLCQALRMARTDLYKSPELSLSAQQHACFQDLLRRRRRGVPVAYLTQRKEFWSLELEVDPAVLIPRPETECLVEAALDLITQTGARDIADLGTGSGAIALAIAKERPQCRVVASDICPRALALARRNQHRLGLDNMELREGDWWEALPPQQHDMVLANPPYVASHDPCLSHGDPRFEPKLALAGGNEGLGSIARIIAGAHRSLRPGGYLLLEHGSDHAQPVRQLITASGLVSIGSRRDYQGHDRVIMAIRPGCPEKAVK